MQKNLLRSEKGQVAFFVILIFQVLFVFFAMVVNVGLLVHHKINLQNSVDLAAYYGGTKLAEMMNVIAHVNYQIRQAYKLLNFRVNHIGTGGIDAENPWNWGTQQVRSEEDRTVNYDPVFCTTYNPFNNMNANETYCRRASGLKLPGIEAPNLVTGIGAIFFSGFQGPIAEIARQAQIAAAKGCKETASSNWFTLARFLNGYKLDVRNRKQLLISLANEVSKSDPLDVDGKSIREGVYKTLIKNLTYQNAAELQSRYGADGNGSSSETAKFEMINGLSIGDCGTKGAEYEPPGWLTEVNIYPLIAFMNAAKNGCDGGESNIVFEATYINGPADGAGPRYMNDVPGMPQIYQQLAPNIAEPSGEDPVTRLYKSSLGFEKNPWCMSYVGVSATTTPKIPFSPLGDVKLVARAYAKPFGGRIGPWYSTTWANGQNESGGGTKTDAVAAMRVGYGTFNINVNDPQTKIAMRLNQSRYMGDKVGIRSELTTSQFGRAIRAPQIINRSWWEHLTSESIGEKGQSGDPLAWDATSAPRMRDIEIAAVAPDNFDVSYYSIEPDFYNTYLTRLQRAYGSKYSFDIRGDLGFRANSSDPEIQKFSVRNQINSVRTINPVDTAEKLTYIVNEFAQTLTSWQGISPYDYNLDPARFGKCVDGEILQTAPENEATSGACATGGRTGYSVKLVDGNFIKNSTNLELGGAGIRGSLKNLPPNNF